MQLILVYITAADKPEAERIARALLEQRRIACANLLPGVCVLYRWEGKTRETEEYVIIAKTTAPQLQGIIDKVNELHSYACPCVVAVPIEHGNPLFLEWIAEETA